MPRGLPFIVAAPSGAGKTTLVNNALSELQSTHSIERMITYTTRPIRKNEVNGVDYHFVDKEKFKHLQSQNFFFEVTEYNDNCYGSPRSLIDQTKEGKSFLAITDRPGIVSYRNLCDKIVAIWINPPSIEVLSERLIARGSETDAGLQKRLNLATEEMRAEQENPLCEFHITNLDVSDATMELVNIVKSSLAAES